MKYEIFIMSHSNEPCELELWVIHKKIRIQYDFFPLYKYEILRISEKIKKVRVHQVQL